MTLNWWTLSPYAFQRIQLSVLSFLLINPLEVRIWFPRLYLSIKSPQTARWICMAMVATCSARDKTVHRDVISATTWDRGSAWRTIINLTITAVCSVWGLTAIVVTTGAMQKACEFVCLDSLIQLPIVHNLVSFTHVHVFVITSCELPRRYTDLLAYW